MTLVVGYDESPASRAALDVTLGLASALGDAVVIVYGVAPPGRRGEEFRELERAVEEMGREATAHALDKAAAAGVPAEVVLVHERPADALLDVGQERGARMIVVGRYNESPLKAALIGSTTYRLLHQTDVPVLVVPVPEEPVDA